MNQLVGIDLIHFATADYFLGLDTFAKKKGEEINKYHLGLDQKKMSIAPPDEDVVTLAAKAAEPILQQIDRQEISAILFATESGVDQSKSAGAFLHGLLGLSNRCRVIELKHACYAGAAALQMGRSLVIANPHEKVLVIASDVARYDQGTAAEATQGCGAVAMLLSTNPRIMVLEAGTGYYTEDVMDFWRPNNRDTALVDGKYSTKVYLNSLKHAWEHFNESTQRNYEDINYFCYHIPFNKMAEKAHKQLAKQSKVLAPETEIMAQITPSQHYNRLIGNSYSASLFIGLCSLLDHQPFLAKKRIGMFSYGSGCVAEFFTGIIQPGYQKYLFSKEHLKNIEERQELNYEDYAEFYYEQVFHDENLDFPKHNKGAFRLTGIKNHKRCYESRNQDKMLCTV